jgi:hypothetical protein
MASLLYDKGREGFLDGSIDWDTDTIKCCLLDLTLYTLNASTHTFLSDVASGARIGTPQTLASKTVTAGVADAADVTFPSVALGNACAAFLLWKDTGVAGTSRLIAYIDGFSVTPNGGNINVQFDNGGNKIFKL